MMSAMTGAKSKMLRKTPTRVVAMHQRNMSSSVPETARLHKGAPIAVAAALMRLGGFTRNKRSGASF